MRAVQAVSFGGPEVVRLNEVDAPQAGAGQVLVRVVAAGVNPVDWKVRQGYMSQLPLPVTLGCDLAGTVAAVGEGVSGFAVGDEVHGGTGAVGAFADLVVVGADALAHKPKSMSMAEAAALPVAVATANAAFKAGAVGKGTRILIHAASGGVGTVAVQLARALGAEVTALASPANIDFVRGLGAQHVVDRTTRYEDSLGGFDVVLDAFGPEAAARSWGLLRPGGIMVTLAAPADEEAAASHGVRAQMVFGVPIGADLAAADALAEKGQLKVTIAASYPLAQVGEALAQVETGKVRGKVVLTF